MDPRIPLATAAVAAFADKGPPTYDLVLYVGERAHWAFGSERRDRLRPFAPGLPPKKLGASRSGDFRAASAAAAGLVGLTNAARLDAALAADGIPRIDDTTDEEDDGPDDVPRVDDAVPEAPREPEASGGDPDAALPAAPRAALAAPRTFAFLSAPRREGIVEGAVTRAAIDDGDDFEAGAAEAPVLTPTPHLGPKSDDEDSSLASDDDYGIESGDDDDEVLALVAALPQAERDRFGALVYVKSQRWPALVVDPAPPDGRRSALILDLVRANPPPGHDLVRYLHEAEATGYDVVPRDGSAPWPPDAAASARLDASWSKNKIYKRFLAARSRADALAALPSNGERVDALRALGGFGAVVARESAPVALAVKGAAAHAPLVGRVLLRPDDDDDDDDDDKPPALLRVVDFVQGAVVCAPLVGGGARVELDVATARGAARTHAEAEEAAMGQRFGAKLYFRSQTPRCNTCRFCLDMSCNGGPNTLRQSCVVHQREKAQHFLSLGIQAGTYGVKSKPLAKKRARDETGGADADAPPQLCPICFDEAPADSALDCQHRIHPACLARLAAVSGHGQTRLSATVRCPLCRAKSRAPTSS